jgi:dynein heavy chain
LKRYYNPEILEEKYQLSDSDIYFVPNVGQVEDYRKYIESLPFTDDPEVFGMHENANITYQRQESTKVLETVLSIQPRTATGASGKSPDEIVFDLAKEILEELPENLKKEEAQKQLF